MTGGADDFYLGDPKSREFRYGESVRKAADWLLDRSRPERGGLIYSEHPSEAGCYMIGHGLAITFLAGLRHYEKQGERAKRIDGAVARGSSTWPTPSRPRGAGTRRRSAKGTTSRP